MEMRPTVVCVVGAGRSGSTLLDTALGSIDGSFSTGELRQLWRRGLLESRRCGCGQRVLDCEVWGRVLDERTPSGERLLDRPPAQVVGWQDKYARIRHTRKLLKNERDRARLDPDLHEYLATMDLLFRRISDVTGARLIIDSSKRASDAAVAAALPSVDVAVIHLVRDPNAVAYSWTRHKPELDANSPEAMPNQTRWASLRVWNELNLAAEVVTRSMKTHRTARVYYENLVSEPRQTMQQLLEEISPDSANPVTLDGTVQLGVNHTVGGNPRRFEHGSVDIRPDNEWYSRTSARDRFVGYLLTAPLSYRYGYPKRSGLSD